jgi:hypothetical protein
MKQIGMMIKWRKAKQLAENPAPVPRLVRRISHEAIRC